MSLLKDAILETKQVKAMALANAKMALEETFQPSLQRLVSSKIAEEDGEEDPELDIDIDIEGDNDEPAVGFGGGEEDLGGEEEMDFEEPTEDPELEEEWSEDEIEEAVRSFMESDEMEDEEEMFEGEELDFEDDELTELFEEDDMEFEEDPELAEIFEEEGFEDDEMMEEEEMDFSDEEIEEIFEEDGTYDSKVSVRRTNTESLRREVRKLQSKLNEALRSNVVYKKAINEVNLLNAKLMYSQKVMQQYDLNKDQKVKVLEAFDRANTVREVQGKYKDIVSLMNGRKKPARKITEGAASKPVRQIKEPITRLDEGVKRYQVLAGLKPAYE